MDNNNEGFVTSSKPPTQRPPEQVTASPEVFTTSSRPPIPKSGLAHEIILGGGVNKRQNIIPAIITYPVVAIPLALFTLNGMVAALMAAVIAGGVYGLTNSKRYPVRKQTYKRLHGNPQTYLRALKLASYPAGNNICQTCYLPFTEFNSDNTHSCDITVGYIQPEGAYDAVLKDWQGKHRWVCGHKHQNSYDAEMCGWSHYDMHVSGECRCAYFPQTTTRSTSNQPRSHVYIVANESLNAIKIGISSNVLGVRIREHAENGWSLIAYYPNLMWDTAYNAEQSTIEEWRRNNIGFGVYFNEMPQKGATETAPLHIVDIQKLVDSVSHKTGVEPRYSLEAGK